MTPSTPQPPSLPKFTSPVVLRQLKTCTLPYHDFANAFKDLDMQALQKVTADNTEVFTQVCRLFV